MNEADTRPSAWWLWNLDDALRVPIVSNASSAATLESCKNNNSRRDKIFCTTIHIYYKNRRNWHLPLHRTMTEEVWAALEIKHTRQRGLSCFFAGCSSLYCGAGPCASRAVRPLYTSYMLLDFCNANYNEARTLTKSSKNDVGVFCNSA